MLYGVFCGVVVCVLINVSVWFLCELLCDVAWFGCLCGFVCSCACL